MRGKLVTVFGGSGFLGSYLIPKLRAHGAMVRVAVRDTDQAIALRTSGPTGQVELQAVNLQKEESVSHAIGDSDYVVNLIGILYESRKSTFQRVHVEFAKRIATVAAKHNVKKLVQVSAIGANRDSPSKYASTKAHGEIEVLKAFPDATIIRPSVIFGPEDNFFNKFATMAEISPFLPLIGGGKTKLQPVYIGDVAEAIVHTLEDQADGSNPHAGKTYELGGPAVYTFRELMTMVLQDTHKRRLLITLPYPVASFMGAILGILPTPPLTRDQVKLTKTDSVVSEKALTLRDLNIEPTAVETIVPGYLQRYRSRG